MGGNEGLWAGVDCRVNVWSSVEVKCWTSAGHWTERERESERAVVYMSMCVCTLCHMWRETTRTV